MKKTKQTGDPTKELITVCICLINKLEAENIPIPKQGDRPLGKCFVFFQTLYHLSKKFKLNVGSYWFRDGVVIDPESLMFATEGAIQFKWDEECIGCQIEKECPCNGNPNNLEYTRVEAMLRATFKSSESKVVTDETEG